MNSNAAQVDVATGTGTEHAVPGPRSLILGALGVVYGDIGTSPLYTLRECFTQNGGFPLDPQSVLGVLSLVFWALFIVVTIKYVTFIMRADNQGEGGILALTALALRTVPSDSRRAWVIMALGIAGAALFYGDGFITPAISVLSAVEGLNVATTMFESYVIPITVTILVALFLFQRHGTERVGALFGPVMGVWFGCIGFLGLVHIVQNPWVLQAMLPTHAIDTLIHHGWHGFLLLGAVVLAITGGEALYADMGHFGRRPIRLAWFGFVLPTLLLNYFGQGALLISDPQAIENPFFLLAPSWALYPMVGLATVATVIASQAVITGAFSMTQQAIRLRYLPRLQICHTSEHEIGQIYLPRVNWMLLAGVITLVVGFRSSSNLAAAYGIAVTGTMVMTTLLAYIVARKLGGWSLLQAGAALVVFLTVDLAFFGANLLKFTEGGWFPVAVASAIFTLMATWRRGRQTVVRHLAAESMPLKVLLNRLKAKPVQRVPGTAVFLTGNIRGVPHALLHNLKHNKVLHERNVITTVVVEGIPHVPEERRFELKELDAGFYRLLVRYGFKDETDVPKALNACRSLGLTVDMMATSFFISRETLVPSGHPDLPPWQEKIFVALSGISTSATDYFHIPPNRVVELGTQVEI